MRVSPKCIITSPPYFDVRRYPAATQIGFGQGLDSFMADIKLVFGELFKRAHHGASFWIVADAIRKDGELIPLPHLFADVAKAVGWRLQSTMVWQKDRTYPWAHEGRLRKIHETILFLSKGEHATLNVDRIRDVDNTSEWWLGYPERYNPRGRVPVDIWFEKIPMQGSWGKPYLRHECPFPPRLVERMIELSTNRGDWVVDPFAGTGVVAATAAVMGRNGLAIDVAEEFERHFHSDVKPAVAEWWQSRRLERDLLQARQRAFFRANVALRLGKYARVLLDRLARRDYELLGAWLDAGPLRKEAPWTNVLMTLLTDEPRLETLEREIATIMARPPLSKFGLHVEVSISRPDRFKGRAEAFVQHAGSLNGSHAITRSEFGRLCREAEAPLVASSLQLEAKDILAVKTRYWSGAQMVAPVEVADETIL